MVSLSFYVDDEGKYFHQWNAKMRSPRFQDDVYSLILNNCPDKIVVYVDIYHIEELKKNFSVNMSNKKK